MITRWTTDGMRVLHGLLIDLETLFSAILSILRQMLRKHPSEIRQCGVTLNSYKIENSYCLVFRNKWTWSYRSIQIAETYVFTQLFLLVSSLQHKKLPTCDLNITNKKKLENCSSHTHTCFVNKKKNSKLLLLLSDYSLLKGEKK